MKKYITPVVKTVQLSEEDILTLSVSASGSNPNNHDFVKNFLTV